jgi:hypothetical protein
VRKVTSEISVSRRRRSPSARSALPPEASLAQLRKTLGRSAMSRSRRQRCERGQRRSRLEKKLRRPRSRGLPRSRRRSSGSWNLARSSTGGTNPRVGLMSSGVSWLRLWSGRSSRLLGPGSWRRPWRRWPRCGADIVLRGGDPPTVLLSEAKSDSAEGGVDAEGAAAPLIDV